MAKVAFEIIPLWVGCVFVKEEGTTLNKGNILCRQFLFFLTIMIFNN